MAIGKLDLQIKNFLREKGLHNAMLVGFHSVSPPLSKGGNPNFENFKKGGEPEKKFWGGGNQKGGERFSKIKGGGTQLFKLNLGIEKNKNEDF